MVHDNGVGFDASTIKDRQSLGLVGMRERALMMDGHFEISGGPGKGTEVRVTFPLDETGQMLMSKKRGGTIVG
jgi:signal transduction histidine kinase